MFIPIGDSPNPAQTPWMTWALIGANVAIYLLVTLPLERGLTPEDLDPAMERALTEMWQAQGDRYEAHGLGQREWLASLTLYSVYVFENGYQPGRPQLADLLYCMFLHGGLLHLLGNMLFLWIFGDNIEARLGRLAYLLAYLATGVVATLSFASLNSDSLTPLVGASGAISGVLGFYLIWYPRNRVNVFIWLGWWLMDTIAVPAFWVLLFYLVIDNLLPFFLSDAQSGVAYGAHIGGFVAGAIAALLLRPLFPETRHFRPEVLIRRRGRRW